MPANMIRAALGDTLYVTGRSSATVIAGPMPGSTPTAVPSSTPTTANSRFSGASARPKPVSSASITRSPASEDPVQDAGRDRDAQTDVEPVPGGHREHGADDEVAYPVTVAEHGGGA